MSSNVFFQGCSFVGSGVELCEIFHEVMEQRKRKKGVPQVYAPLFQGFTSDAPKWKHDGGGAAGGGPSGSVWKRKKRGCLAPALWYKACMPSRSDAEEHLKIIRSLMERATVYRAITAPAAAIGGVLAFALSAWESFFGVFPVRGGKLVSGNEFMVPWFAVLFVAMIANFGFLWMDARRRGAPFFSSAMRLALQSVAPSYLTALFWTVVFYCTNHAFWAAPCWMIFHGLALLATWHFAPRSLAFLGWGFLASGLLASTCIFYAPDPAAISEISMGASFGLLNLIYAAAAWPRRSERQTEELLAA